MRRQCGQLSPLLCSCGRLDPIRSRVAELIRQFRIQHARVAALARGDFSREQRRHHAVLVGGPDGAVPAQECRAGAFLATEAQRGVLQASGKPFEADRNFVEAAAQPCRQPVDQSRADDGLADGSLLPPPRAALKQVVDRDRQVMVGRQQAGSCSDDPVAVMVRVAGEGDVEAVLDGHQALHRIGRRRVHPDASVPIEGHEGKRRVDDVTDHRQIEAVACGDGGPVMNARAAQRVHTHPDFRFADRLHVDCVAKIADIGIEKIVAMRRRRLQGGCVGNALDALQLRLEQTVGQLLDPAGGVLVGRAAIRRVVFEAAIARRIVRRRHHDTVSQAGTASAVVHQDGMRDRRRRRVFVVCRQHDVDAIRRQHLECAGARRAGQCVRVDAQE